MDYTLVFQKRRTLAITLKDGVVTVKAPNGTSKDRIDRFVAEKSAWLYKKLAEYDAKVGALKPVIDGSHIMLGGEICPVVLSDEYKRVRFENGVLNVPSKNAADVAKAVGNWYKRTADGMLRHTLERYSLVSGLKYASFSITNARGKWGSCDGNGNIRLNWRLIMLDDALVEYVAIHELSHTVHHDHSAAFWAEVGKHCPDYKAKRKRLKNYSVLTSLYR